MRASCQMQGSRYKPNTDLASQPKREPHILCQTWRLRFNSNVNVAPQRTRREGWVLCQMWWSCCSSICGPQGCVSTSTRKVRIQRWGPHPTARSASNETRVSDETDNSYWVN